MRRSGANIGELSKTVGEALRDQRPENVRPNRKTVGQGKQSRMRSINVTSRLNACNGGAPDEVQLEPVARLLTQAIERSRRKCRRTGEGVTDSSPDWWRVRTTTRTTAAALESAHQQDQAPRGFERDHDESNGYAEALRSMLNAN